VAEQRVSIESDDRGVADVRLARPDKMNALDDAMFRAIADATRRLARDRGLRAVVLSGEGRAFCAGLDTGSFAAIAASAAGGGGERERDEGDGGEPRGLLAREHGIATRAQEAAWAWYELPVPVIAAVHGACFGGGLQIALGADIRFVAPDAKLSVMEARWGLVPDMAGTQLLRRLMPLDRIKELTFTARVLSGVEACELGLATHLSDDPRAAATGLAHEIAGRSPEATRAAKRLLNASGVIGEAEGLALEASLQASVMGRPNQIEAVKANLEKREPRFSDPE